MIILGIETSCDETSVAVVQGRGERLDILSHITASQVALHRKTSGVVPEVAARAHVEKIIPVSEKALADANITIPDVIAVTSGPGLVTSLMVGVDTAKALAFAWRRPLVAVQHIAGHIYANWISSSSRRRLRSIRFPLLALVASGGHTELVLMRGHLDFKKIGQTLDDAAGEAFDKVARILNLSYPGGPSVSHLAEKGNSRSFSLPRPMITSASYDFSFSGLKTAVLYLVRDLKSLSSHRSDIAASFEQAVIDVLVEKTIRGAKAYQAKTVLLAGGVAANKKLRTTLADRLKRELPKTAYLKPPLPLCTDNGAMIGAAGYFLAKQKKFSSWKKLRADSNWELP